MNDDSKIIQQYRNSNDKINFFNSCSVSLQFSIFNQLNEEEKKELLSNLSFLVVGRMLQQLPYHSDERRGFVESIPNDTLQAIYRNSSDYDREFIKEDLAYLYAKQEVRNEEIQKDIIKSSSRIDKAQDNISESYVNIANSNLHVSSLKNDLKQNKIVLKSVIRDRDKLLKKLNKVQLKRESRFGFVNRRRINKMKELTSSLKDVSFSIDDIRKENDKLRDEISREEENISREKYLIDVNRDIVLESKNNISLSNKELKNNSVRMREISETEREVLGRKMYKRQVSLHQDFITSCKRNDIENVKSEVNKVDSSNKVQSEGMSSSNDNKVEESTNLKENEGIKTSDSKQDNLSEDRLKNMENNIDSIKGSIEDLKKIISDLSVNGVKPVSNSVPLVANSNLISNIPTFTMDAQQFYKMYAMMIYLLDVMNKNQNMNYQNVNQDVIVDDNDLSVSNVRTLKPRGVVNISLMLVVVSIMLVLFIILTCFG